MLQSEAVEAGFWNAIAAAPDDEGPRLIFADWLEDRNDPRGPLLRERQYARHLNAECRDPVQVVLGILDACPTYASDRLLQAAALVGAPLVPGLLERCRAAKSSHHLAAIELLGALSSGCLRAILPDLIDLLPRHGEEVARVLAQLGKAAVPAVPALLEAQRMRQLDRIAFAETIARIGPKAGTPEVVARLVDLYCEAQVPTPDALVEALAVVALSRPGVVLGTVLKRAPGRLGSLAWKLVPEKEPVPAGLRKALRSADDCVRWGAACVLARRSPDKALPQLLDALRRAPAPMLQAIVWALSYPDRKIPEAVPLLRALLAQPELAFACDIARALLAVCDDQAEEALRCLQDPDPLVRQRVVLALTHKETGDERVRRALVHALLDPDGDVRRAAATYCTSYLFLSKQDTAVVAPLRQALGDADAQVRAGAANALRQLERHAAPAEPDLLALLRQDADAKVRRSAACTLATLGYETQAVFAALVAGLDDSNDEVRQTCAWGLCHWEAMTAERVRVVLSRLRQDDGYTVDYLQYAVCKSLAALPEVVAFLRDALRSTNSTLRSAAAVSLGRLRVDDPTVLANLFNYLDTRDMEYGAESLCRMGPAALPGLLERLRHGSAELREQLLSKVADLRHDHPHLDDLLPGVLTCLGPDDEVQRAALRVLRGCKRRSAEAARLVEPLIWQTRDSSTRRTAVAILAALSPQPLAVAQTFAALQKDRDAEVRSAILYALGDLGLPPQVELELLRAALNDQSEFVRTTAARRARSLGPAAVTLLPELRRLLDDLTPKEWGWSAVVRTLESIGAAAAPDLDAGRAREK